MVCAGFQGSLIQVAEPNQDRAKFLVETYGVKVKNSLDELDFTAADALILAVKPQVLLNILKESSEKIPPSMLLVSIAAGVTCEQIGEQFEHKMAVIRCMPNTPAMVQMGMSVLFSNNDASEQQKDFAVGLLACVGEVFWVTDQFLLNGVTAVSGSGPAYFFYLMEGLMRGGMNCGLTEVQSKQLVLQTALGAAKLALNSDQPLSDLRQQVTSKGGTTEAGISVMASADMLNTLDEAVQAAYNRSIELSEDGSTS